jgi:hypothetical protein
MLPGTAAKLDMRLGSGFNRWTLAVPVARQAATSDNSDNVHHVIGRQNGLVPSKQSTRNAAIEEAAELFRAERSEEADRCATAIAEGGFVRLDWERAADRINAA